MRLLPRVLAPVVVALACAAPAGAILNGTPDSEHPYVGILATRIGGHVVPVCSGFLVSSTVFVTAAHCVDDLGSLPALVSFDEQLTATSTLVGGDPVPNPLFGSSRADTHDIALVVLDTQVRVSRYAQLPGEGLLGSVAKKDPLTIVGYGASGFLRGGGPPVPDFQLVRNEGSARVSKVEKAGFNLRMSSGICFGDSGGPVLLEGTDVAVGLSSFVNSSTCAGNAYAYRLDTAESLLFLAPYL